MHLDLSTLKDLDASVILVIRGSDASQKTRTIGLPRWGYSRNMCTASDRALNHQVGTRTSR